MAHPKATDARLASAISHWAPRLVSNGVLLADFEDVTRSLARWDDWCAAWCERARLHEALGRKALLDGFRLSAGEHLVRAGIYYHFAKFVFVQDTRQMRAAHTKAVECYAEGIALARPAGRVVTIPFEGRALKGILRLPAGPRSSHCCVPCPVLVMAPGLDSTKEEIHAYEEPFLARGIAVLAIDGPGQGEAEYELPICSDYERPAAAVCDWIETQQDLDRTRIAIWGVSLGGYHAPRAFAYERRFKACISISGPFDMEAWDRLPVLTRETFRVRSHSKDDAEARDKAAALTLAHAAGEIDRPLFIVGGRQDRLVPPADAERLARAVKGPVVVVMVEDGGHNANNRPYRYRSQSADWLVGQLGMQNV